MHLLVFFSLLVESFVIFFRQFICRVVTIILLVSNFPDLVRSFRSSSFTLQNFQDKPCCDNSAYGTIKYAQKKFLWRHFIKFVENQIYLILPRHAIPLKSTVVLTTWNTAKFSVTCLRTSSPWEKSPWKQECWARLTSANFRYKNIGGKHLCSANHLEQRQVEQNFAWRQFRWLDVHVFDRMPAKRLMRWLTSQRLSQSFPSSHCQAY